MLLISSYKILNIYQKEGNAVVIMKEAVKLNIFYY